jgi:hypothetical protein
MAGYLESVYDRWELKGFSSSWLRGFNNRAPNNEFEEAGIQLYDQYQLSEEAKRTANPTRLKEIQELLFPQEESPLKNDAVALIEEKLDKVTNKIKLKIEGDINSTEEYSDLEKIKKEINYLPSYMDNYKQDLINNAESKQDKINKELVKLTEQHKEERIKEEAEEKKQANINKRKEDINLDITRIRDLEDISKIQKRIDNLSDEADTSDLESQVEGIRRGIEEQIRTDRRRDKEEALNSSDKRKRENAARWLREHQ